LWLTRLAALGAFRPEGKVEPRSVVVAVRRSRAIARNAAVWSTLRDALATHQPGNGSTSPLLDILDAGGGTGGFAVPLAELGHRVTVVDPSPDSLAALERRAAEAGITPSAAYRVIAAGLLDVAEPEAYDVRPVPHVLEVVDDPTVAVAAMVRVLRPGGLLSVLVTNVNGAVLSRAVAGRLDEATALLENGQGSSGPHDPLLRRYERTSLLAQLANVGLEVLGCTAPGCSATCCRDPCSTSTRPPPRRCCGSSSSWSTVPSSPTWRPRCTHSPGGRDMSPAERAAGPDR